MSLLSLLQQNHINTIIHKEDRPTSQYTSAAASKLKARAFSHIDLDIATKQQRTVLRSGGSILSSSDPSSSLALRETAYEGTQRLSSSSGLLCRSAAGERATHAPELNAPRNAPRWELYRVLSGHTGWVRSVSVDVSNDFFVSAGNDRLIKVWDLASGRLKLSLTGHTHSIRAVAMHPRLSYLFSASEDNTVRCWDLETNRVVRTYHGHLSGVYSLALHPTLDVAVSGGRDGTVKIWDIRTRVCVHTLTGHTDTVSSVLAQQQNPQIISGSLDQTVRLWDLAAGKNTEIFTHHKKAVRALASHPRLNSIISGAADAVKVWGVGFERNLDSVSSVINTLAISPEGGQVVGGGDDGNLFFWDWATGSKTQTIAGRPQPGSLAAEHGIFSATFDMTGTRIITGECDKTIKMYRKI